jgi:hypothetical protein
VVLLLLFGYLDLFVVGLLLLLLFLAAFAFLATTLEVQGAVLFFLLTQKILSSLHLDVLYPWLLFRREGRVLLLGSNRFLLFVFHFDLFEFGQKPVPVLAAELWVFGELTLDHELFDVVDGVDVFHSVDHDTPHHFYVLKPAYEADCTTLHEYIALCEQF